MGLTYAEVILKNSDDLALVRKHEIGEEEVRSMRVNALVDTGSISLCINEAIQEVLQLPVRGKKLSQMANGQLLEFPVVGPVEIYIDDRYCTTNAILLPDDQEPLLGAIPLEEMDMMVHPSRNKLVPAHPEGPIMKLK